jgi:protease PrsW
MIIDPAVEPAGGDSRDPTVRAVRITAGILCVFGAVVLGLEFYRFLGVFPGAALLAIVLELPPLVLGFWLLRLLRPLRPPPLIWSAAALIWGASAAAGCALIANQGLIALWAKTGGVGFASDWSASLSAPLNEEVLKLCGVVMVVLAAPLLIRGPLDGMIYGALTGLGFQVVENVTYGLDNIVQSGATDPARAVTNSVILRVGTTGLGSHWTMTAVAGAGIGFLVSRERRREGAALAIACLLAAMGMHLLFDAPHFALPAKVVVNFLVASVLYLLLRESYRGRVRDVLDACAASGVISAGEESAATSRRSRRRALRKAGNGPERTVLAERQDEVLAMVESEVAARARTEPLLSLAAARSLVRIVPQVAVRAPPGSSPEHAGDHRHRRAEEHQVEDDLHGHRDPSELPGRMDIPESDRGQRADGEIQTVGLGMQAHEFTGNYGERHVHPGEEQNGKAQQRNKAARPALLRRPQQPEDSGQDEHREYCHSAAEDQRPGGFTEVTGHRDEVVDEGQQRSERYRAGALPERLDVARRQPALS